jgi:serine/threonine-protein kinase
MTNDDDIDSLIRGVAAAPARSPEVPSFVGERVGNYTITRLLGEGGMGAVYLAQHPLIGKEVAIKVLHDQTAHNREAIARFFNEAKAVNDIRHENIVDIIDFGHTRGEGGGQRAYILMELLQGESLRSRLQRGTPSLADTIHILEQAASALGASHEKSIVHRDIKPDNIFLTVRRDDRCFVKLLDFGIVKLGSQESPWKTRTGALIGTPLYMSPEQCSGKGQIDARSDLYSLGLVMFEMLTGRLPFVSDNLYEIFHHHICESPPRPSAIAPNVPPELETIVLRCLEKDPAARFSSMNELETALRSTRAQNASWPNVPTQSTSIAASARLPSHRTTLSESSGQVSQSSAATIPRNKAPLIATVAGIALAGAIATIVALRPTKQTVFAAGQSPLRQAIEEVEIQLDTVPSGALIRRADVPEPVGKTPFRMKLHKGEAAFEVQLSLDGWKNEVRTITSDRDQDVLLNLTRSVPPPVATTQSPTTTESPKPLSSPRGPKKKAPVQKTKSDSLDDGLL